MVREAAVSKLVQTWASTSNDTHPVALAIQLAAQEELGVKGRSWTKGKAQGEATYQHSASVYRDFIRTQYNATQAHFKDLGIKEVTLFRGMKTAAKFTPGPDGSPVTEKTWRPLSSWSTRVAVARSFAGGGSNARLFTATFPVSRILSTSFTGNGCRSEYEVVAITTAGTVKVESPYKNYGY